jgi:hypothetical protein
MDDEQLATVVLDYKAHLPPKPFMNKELLYFPNSVVENKMSCGGGLDHRVDITRV